MFKYVLSAFICLAFAMPATAQCGCDCAPTRTPKKLGFAPKTFKLPQISRKCVTDSCGCSRKKLSIDCVDVQGARLALVDREPCDLNLMQRMRDGLSGLGSNLGNRGCGCGAPAPAPCGCEAAPEPAPCGCGDMGAEPSYDDSIMYSDPVAAPAADCGCNG